MFSTTKGDEGVVVGPPPPPVPPTPPSRGRVLALKCFRKAKRSLSKGLLSQRSAKKGTTPSPSHPLSPEEDQDEGGKELSLDGGASVSASSSSCSVGVGEQKSPQDQEQEQEESLLIVDNGTDPGQEQDSVFSSEYEIVGFGPHPPSPPLDYDEEDDDSSKWTISAPSSMEGPPAPPPLPPVKKKRPAPPPPVQIPSPHPPPMSPSLPGPPPMSPSIPAFPSSSSSSCNSSSSDSWASCVSNPEALLALKPKIKPKPPSLLSSKAIWGRRVLQIEPEPDDDTTEGDVVELESEDDSSLPELPSFWEQQRPETGPGEEHHYQNVVQVSPSDVHTVLEHVPSSVLQVLKDRRRRSSVEDETHGRSSRLSRWLQKDLQVQEVPSGAGGGVGVKLFRRRGWGLNKQQSELRDSQSESSLSFEQDVGQTGSEFEDLRRLVKSGGDFCKDLATVLHERSELECQYAKGLSKLSNKLLKASKEAKGSVAHAWQAVAVQIDTQAELHRQWSSALEDELAKPLRTSTDTQHKIRKSVEGLVDKTTRNLADWRLAEAKSKRNCFSSSKEFEKIQESVKGVVEGPASQSRLSHNPAPNNSVSDNAGGRPRSRLLSVPPSSDKDPIKLESKRRKAEENVRRADVDYYTFCIRSERARLEWESAIRNGSTCLRTLEEEKLSLLKEMAEKYLAHLGEWGPRWLGSVESLQEPIVGASVADDLASNVSDIRRHVGAEQLLPDFYAEDSNTFMNRNRRKEALEKCLYLINQDLDREKKGAIGVESLAKAVAETPQPDHANHDITDKLYYLRSMLLYLEAARSKVDNALADVEGRARSNPPISQYMRHQRDKQGLPQTILKVPVWARDDCLSTTGSSDVRVTSPNWSDRGKADGNDLSGLPGGGGTLPKDSRDREEVTLVVKPSTLTPGPSIGRARAIYDYDANLFDELSIRVGDEINVHDKQEDGWWLGELHGAVGIFPATYVEQI